MWVRHGAGVTLDRREHWNRVYRTKTEQAVSWFENAPAVSLAMIEGFGLTPTTCVLDVGGGESRLVDQLLALGLTCVAVLDVSGAALARARTRLGTAATTVRWIEADVTGDWAAPQVDIWHDRAVFHFLTTVEDRDRYRAHLRGTVKPGGVAIIATFAPDGPAKCSGLDVARYSPESLAHELGPDFTLVAARPHLHTTPGGSPQSFQYAAFQRQP